MPTMIDVECGVCGKPMKRAIGEVNRNKKRNNVICCSKSCQGKVCVKHIPKDANRDDLSPFRRHFISIKNTRNSRKGEKKNCHKCDITIEDLKIQWEKQKGICPYTGWELENPPTTYRGGLSKPNRASVDRIDSSKPYVRENIQFICLMAQFAKNRWSENEFLDFCKAVANNH